MAERVQHLDKESVVQCERIEGDAAQFARFRAAKKILGDLEMNTADGAPDRGVKLHFTLRRKRIDVVAKSGHTRGGCRKAKVARVGNVLRPIAACDNRARGRVEKIPNDYDIDVGLVTQIAIRAEGRGECEALQECVRDAVTSERRTHSAEIRQERLRALHVGLDAAVKFGAEISGDLAPLRRPL